MRGRSAVLGGTVGASIIVALLSAQSARPALSVRGVGLQTPESVLHDATSDLYLVSNINGVPSEKDGNGFISRLSSDGSVAMLRWIAGGRNGVTLHAPKGMAIVGDTLFVADIDCVRKFNRTTGAPSGETCIEGASFLNDVAAGADGTVYVSDTGVKIDASGMTPTGSDAVHRIGSDGTAAVLVQGADLQRPNGLLWTGSGLVVVPFGGNEVWTYDNAGKRTTVASTPSGQLDGVVGLPDGSLLVSSWEAGAVYRISDEGAVTTFVTDVPSPADLGYDAKRRRVAIPLFQDNRIEVFEAP